MTETTHTFKSALLGNERTVWVRAPRNGSQRAHLTIFLDGEIYRDRVGAIATIDDLESKAAIADSWFVFVANSSDASRWLECPCYPPFVRFIADELLPWLEKTWPAIQACQERVLVGLSYTGLAAAFVALQAPGKFTQVIAQSGSFWSNDCWLITQYRQLTKRLPTEFYLDVGLKETEENVRHKEDVFQVVSQVDSTRRFRDLLLAQGYPVNYLEFDGGHDCEEWKKTLPGALRWALPVAE